MCSLETKPLQMLRIYTLQVASKPSLISCYYYSLHTERIIVYKIRLGVQYLLFPSVTPTLLYTSIDLNGHYNMSLAKQIVFTYIFAIYNARRTTCKDLSEALRMILNRKSYPTFNINITEDSLFINTISYVYCQFSFQRC